MEQGPILEAKGFPLGVVIGIAGQTRLHVMMSGVQVRHTLKVPYPICLQQWKEPHMETPH